MSDPEHDSGDGVDAGRALGGAMRTGIATIVGGAIAFGAGWAIAETDLVTGWWTFLVGVAIGGIVVGLLLRARTPRGWVLAFALTAVGLVVAIPLLAIVAVFLLSR